MKRTQHVKKVWNEFIKVTFIFVICSSLIQSCCTKKGCIGSDEMYEIQFYNFTQEELDTIKIVSYNKNTNFRLATDSFITNATQVADYYSAYTSSRISTELDYKITIISTGAVYTLTGFVTEREGCNSCFPYRPESDFYNKLTGYTLNGLKQTSDQIKIYK